MNTVQNLSPAIAFSAYSSLDPHDDDLLKRAIVRAFPDYKLSEYFAEKPSVLCNAHHVVVARDPASEDVLGLVVARWRSAGTIVYLHIEMNLIVASHQRRGLLLPLWRIVLERLRSDDSNGYPEVVAIKTYNPMVYSSLVLVARMTGATLYPSLDLNGDQPACGLLAAQVAADLSPGAPFDASSGVLSGVGIPTDFYPSLPMTNKRRVFNYFAGHLSAGDRVLCLIVFNDRSDVGRLAKRFGVNGDYGGVWQDTASPPSGREAQSVATAGGVCSAPDDPRAI